MQFTLQGKSSGWNDVSKAQSPTRAGQLNADLSLERMDGACIQRQPSPAEHGQVILTALSPGIINTFNSMCVYQL